MKKISSLLSLLFLLQQGFAQTDAKPAATDFSSYGGKVGVGISILDGVGVPARLYRDNSVFELGAYSAGILLEDFDPNNSPVIVSAPDVRCRVFLLRKQVSESQKKRNKVKSHGIALRVNQIVGQYRTTVPSLSWAQEIFREGRTNRSFLFELGIQYGFPNYTYNGSVPDSSVGIRLRCQWNLFLK
jgi:hypothetical protein